MQYTQPIGDTLHSRYMMMQWFKQIRNPMQRVQSLTFLPPCSVANLLVWHAVADTTWEGIDMAVCYSGPVADLKLVWLQCQASTSKPGIGISPPVQPLQSTLVSPYSEWPPKKVHPECFNSQMDCDALLPLKRLWDVPPLPHWLGLVLLSSPYQKHLSPAQMEDSCRDSSVHGSLPTLLFEGCLTFFRLLDPCSLLLTHQISDMSSFEGKFKETCAIVARQT